MDSLSSDDENEDDFFTFQSFTYLRRKKNNSSLSNVTGSSLPEQTQTTNDMIRSGLNDGDDSLLQRRNPILFEHDTEQNHGLCDSTDDEDDELLLLPYKSSFDTTTTTCSIPSPTIAENTHCNNNSSDDDDGDNSDDSDNLLTHPPSFKHHHPQQLPPSSSTPKHTQSTTTKHYHCYLLHSLSPRHPHKTYIGFTTNPYRRLRQHNGILKHGGAFRTKKSGRPWQFVCVIHGFSDKIAALQFEWAWQHVNRSRHVREGLVSCERRRRGRQAAAPAGGFTTPEAEEEYLVTKAKIEAKKMNRRRGVKSRFDMLRLLLVDCMPFNQYALDVHFLQQKWRDTFLDGFKEKKNDSSKTCLLPNAMTSAVLSIEEMPFWITLLREQQQQHKKKGAAGKKRLMEKDSNENNDCAIADKENIENRSLGTHTFDVNKTNTMTTHHAASSSGNNTNRSNTAICFLCSQLLLTNEEKPIQCEKCFIQYHVLCLADYLLDQTRDTAASNTTSGGVGRSKSTLIPTNGSCPKCNADIIWARAMAFRRQNRTFTANTTSNNDRMESIHPPCCSTIAAADVKGISSTAIEKDHNTIILSDDGDDSDHVNNNHPSPKGNLTNICEPNTTWIGTEMEKDVEFPINFDSFDSDDNYYDNDDDESKHSLSKTSTDALNSVDSSSTTSNQNDDKDNKCNNETNLDFSFSCLDDEEKQEHETSTTILSEKRTIGIDDDNDSDDDEEEKDTNAIAFSQESNWTITKALSSECIIDLCSSDSDDNHHES